MGSSPFLAYCPMFYRNVREDVDLHICICICTSHCLHIAARGRRCSALASRRLADLVSDLVFCRVTVGHVTAAVFEQCARVLIHFSARRCWLKIDIAVNFGEKSSAVLCSVDCE